MKSYNENSLQISEKNGWEEDEDKGNGKWIIAKLKFVVVVFFYIFLVEKKERIFLTLNRVKEEKNEMKCFSDVDDDSASFSIFHSENKKWRENGM